MKTTLQEETLLMTSKIASEPFIFMVKPDSVDVDRELEENFLASSIGGSGLSYKIDFGYKGLYNTSTSGEQDAKVEFSVKEDYKYVSPWHFVDGGYMKLERFDPRYMPGVLGHTIPARTFGGGYIAIVSGASGDLLEEIAVHEIKHNRYPDASELEVRQMTKQQLPGSRYQL